MVVGPRRLAGGFPGRSTRSNAPASRAAATLCLPILLNPVGLQWQLQVIGTSSETKPLPPTRPFRFSLCEGRYLTADEVSRPCYPSPESKVTGGHNAPYVFSPGHGTPLPRGLGIDGNGILHGDDPALLSGGLPLCVRQIDVERCKEIHFGKDTLSGPDPIAKAIDNGSGPPKKGMNAGRALVVAGGLGLAAIGVGVAASALQMPVEEGSSSCGTAPTLVIVSAGGQPSSGLARRLPRVVRMHGLSDRDDGQRRFRLRELVGLRS